MIRPSVSPSCTSWQNSLPWPKSPLPHCHCCCWPLLLNGVLGARCSLKNQHLWRGWEERRLGTVRKWSVMHPTKTQATEQEAPGWELPLSGHQTLVSLPHPIAHYLRKGMTWKLPADLTSHSWAASLPKEAGLGSTFPGITTPQDVMRKHLYAIIC